MLDKSVSLLCEACVRAAETSINSTTKIKPSEDLKLEKRFDYSLARRLLDLYGTNC
jgi:hypothetical protein